MKALKIKTSKKLNQLLTDIYNLDVDDRDDVGFALEMVAADITDWEPYGEHRQVVDVVDDALDLFNKSIRTGKSIYKVWDKDWNILYYFVATKTEIEAKLLEAQQEVEQMIEAQQLDLEEEAAALEMRLKTIKAKRKKAK